MIKFIQKISVFGVITILFMIATHILLDNPYTHNLIRGVINKEIEERYPVQIRYQSIGFNFTNLSADLFGVQVDFKTAPKSQRTFKASRIRVSLSIVSVLLGHLKLDSIAIFDPLIRWSFNQKDYPELQSVGTSKKTLSREDFEKGAFLDHSFKFPPKIPIPIAQISIHGGNFYGIVIGQETTYVGLDGIHLDLSADSWKQMEINASIEQINIATGSNYWVEDTKFKLEGALKDRVIKLSNTEINGNRIFVHTDGEIHLQSQSHRIVSLTSLAKVDYRMDLSLLQSILDVDNSSGELSGKARISNTFPLSPLGAQAALEVTGTGFSKQAQVDGYALFGSNFAFHADLDKLTVNDLEVVSKGKKWGKGTGSVGFSSQVPIDFTFSVDDAPFLGLMEVADVKFSQMQGKVTTESFKFFGTLEPLDLKIQSLGSVDGLRMPILELDSDWDPFENKPYDPYNDQKIHCALNVDIRIISKEVLFHQLDTLCDVFPTLISSTEQKTRAKIIKNSLKKHLDKNLRIKKSDVSKKLNLSTTRPKEIDNFFSFSGIIPFDENLQKSVELDLVGENFDLNLLGMLFKIQMTGTGSAQLKITEPEDKMKISGSFKSRDSKVHGYKLNHLETDFAFLDRSIYFSKTKMFNMVLSDPDKLAEDVNTSSFDVDPTVKGTALDPEKPATDDRLELAMEFSQGKIQLEKPYPMSWMLSFYKVSESSIDQWLRRSSQWSKNEPIPLGFSLNSGNLLVEGPALYPGLWVGNGMIQGSRLHYGDLDISDQFSLNYKSDKQGIHLQDIFLENSNSKIKGELNLVRFDSTTLAPPTFGSSSIENIWNKLGLDLKDKVDLQFYTQDAENRVQQQITSFPILGPALKNQDISGQFHLKSNLKGTLADLNGTIDLHLNYLHLNGSPVAPVAISGFIENKKLIMNVDHGGRTLEGRFVVDFSESLEFDLYIRFIQLDLRAFLGKPFYRDPRNYLYLSGRWEFQGDVGDFWRGLGLLEVEGCRLKYFRDVDGRAQDVEFYLKNPTNITMSSEGWKFQDDKKLEFISPYGGAKVHLGAMQPPERLDIQVEGNFSTKMLAHLVKEVESATGEVQVRADITGSMEDIATQIHFKNKKEGLEPLSLGLASIRPPFNNIEVDATYQNGALDFWNLKADKGNGNIELDGTFVFGGNLDSSDINVRLTDAGVVLPLPYLKSFETVLSGSIKLQGNKAPYRLLGDIDVVKGRSNRYFDIRNEIINAVREKSLTTDGMTADPLVELDIRVNAEDSITIHNRNLQVQMAANLLVKGTDARPQLEGDLEIIEGKFVYKRDFRFTRAVISFNDKIKIDPELDIVALAEISPYKVYINISGRVSDPVVEFTVDPAVKEDGSPITPIDTLILVSRGALPSDDKSIDEVGSAGGTATAEGLNILAGQFEQPLEKLLNLTGQNIVQELYIDAKPSESDGEPVIRANIPIHLVQDVDLVLRVDDRNNLGFSAEYPLHQNISVSGNSLKRGEGETLSKGEISTSLDLKFRFSFP